MISNNIQIRQSLSLSHSQIFSLSLLEMPQLELEKFLSAEFESNPLLRRDDNIKSILSGSPYRNASTSEKDWSNIADTSPYYDENIETELLFQLNLSYFSNRDIEIMKYLISFLDEKGFFDEDLKELQLKGGYTLKELQKNLTVLKSLEPEGIFSKNPSEGLIYQLKQRGKLDDISEMLINRHLDDLLMKNFSKIRKTAKVKTSDIKNTFKNITKLSPYPFFNRRTEASPYIIPDILASRTDNGWIVELNDDFVAMYSYDDYYLSMIEQAQDEELKSYFKEKMQRARFVMDGIQKRRQTLLKISECILEYQSDYFLENKPLLPMKLQDIAERAELNISTVSRAIKDKSIQFKKIVALKELFVSKICNGDDSSQCIKLKIQEIIDSENEAAPLSDFDIAELLKKQNINISRRTIAKYRDALNILPSSQRKKI